jgi:hypothetical protein
MELGKVAGEALLPLPPPIFFLSPDSRVLESLQSGCGPELADNGEPYILEGRKLIGRRVSAET